MKKIVKRIGIFICSVVLCVTMLPMIIGELGASAAVSSILDLPGVEMNGAVLVTDETKYIPSTSYITDLDNGFNTASATQWYALRKGDKPMAYASFYIATLGEGGSVYKDNDLYNGYNSYGFIAGSGEPIYRQDETTGEDVVVGYDSIAININYNYDSLTNLDGTDGKKWDISSDSWKSSINGMDSVGVVGKGAVIVQKFVPTEDKAAPQTAADWKRLNEFSGQETDGVHTVDFFGEYTPAKYYGKPFAVYTPSGKDLQSGVYVKLTVAYELVHDDPYENWFGKTKHRYTYKNVLEETVFYLCNTSGEVVFTNLYYEQQTGDDAEVEEGVDNTTSAEQKGGIISDKQGAIDGFRADINGWNYDVTYRYNGSTNAFPCADGQVFLETGKYEFCIKTKLGMVRYKTVYIHEKTEAANVKVYFGDSLFTSDSIRVFMPSETYPVYVKGYTTLHTQNENAGLVQHAPLVGRVYRFDQGWDEIERDENGMPIAEITAVKEATDYNWTFSNLSAGKYEVIFANNEDFFDGEATGDTYKFVWRFTIIDEGFAPFVNQENLYQLIAVNDYASLHYVAKLPSKGEGNVLVAFADELSAYNFACKYLASTVQVSNGQYKFDYVAYDTEAEMLVKLREKARTMVEKRYFNVTDTSTYVSLESDLLRPVLGDKPTAEDQAYYDAYVDVLNQSFDCDVLVFSTEDGRESFAVGEPFLNDRNYAYINSDGGIETKTEAFKFVSVADFESKFVTLTLEGTYLCYTIPYGVGVQSYLEGLNAPSGRYTIKETNTWGESEYSAIYIRPGDMTGSIQVERLYNSNYAALTINKLNEGQHIKANNFKIASITNALDPYGLIQIKKDGEMIITCQIDEAAGMEAFDEVGNYEITLIDRLGNSFTVYFDIYNAEKVYTLTYLDGTNVYASEDAYGGKEFTLPVLETTNKKLEFYGWQDEEGNVYTGSYTFTKPQDVQLFAIWHYSRVDISVYDGQRINLFTNKVGQLQSLPEITKEGYILYGYRYILSDGTIRIYRDQISSVPNVEKMRLDAIWVKEESLSAPLEKGSGNEVKVSLVDGALQEVLTIEKEAVIELPTPQAAEGMSFVGWLYEYKLKGVIFDKEFSCADLDDIGFADANSIKLTAVWMSETSTAAEVDDDANLAGTLGNRFGPGGLVANVIKGRIPLLLGSLLIALAMMVYLCIDKARMVRKARLLNVQDMAVEAISANESFAQKLKTPRVVTRKRFRWRGLWKVVVTPAICLLLSFTFLFDSASGLISAIANEGDSKETVTNSASYDGAGSIRDTQLDIAMERVKASLSVADEEEDKAERRLEFLYSNVWVDLISMGYQDVFTATATIGNKVVEGIGYTAYVDAYEEDGGYIFGAGFISLADETYISKEDAENGVIVHVSEEEAVEFEYTEFKLTFNQVWGPIHYVAYEHYTYYQVADYVVSYSITPDNGEYIDAYGDVYSYDINDYCHFVNYGETFEFDAYGLSQELDYDSLVRTYRESIEEQTRNAVDVESIQADFISIQALNDYIVQGQDEKFLGLSAETLLYYEANIEDTQYYIIHEDGTVEVLNLPPDPAAKASVWERIWMGVATVAGAIVGVVACAIPGVGPIIGGAMISASIDLFMQTTIMGVPPSDIDWGSVLTSAIIGAVTGGIGQAGNLITKGAVEAAKTFGKKLLIKLGTAVVSGLVSGSATYLIGAAMCGEELTWKDYFKSVGMGIATAAIACVGGAAIEKIADKSNALFVAMQIVSGAIVSAAGYGLSLAITGAEFSWEAFILATAMGAAMATIMVVGGKIVKTINTARQTREATLNRPKTYNNHKKIINGEDVYFDDNGKMYRTGDTLNPNEEYSINGYTYKTDENGRVVTVEGDLYLKGSGRAPIKDSMQSIGRGEQLSTDHRGHLIGDRFNGGNGLENIVAQDGNLNLREYKTLENTWAAALSEGKTVYVEIETIYNGTSTRPSSFDITYSIDGEWNSVNFNN